MFEEAGIEGDFTNHTLRASAATNLFQSGVPEKVIQEFTEHRSVKALRQYEKVTVCQKEAASNILTGTSNEDSDRLIVDKGKSNHLQSVNNISNNGTSLPFNMPSFSPVLNSNSNGTINFTVNICPSGSIAIGNSTSTYEHLFTDIDLKDFFDD